MNIMRKIFYTVLKCNLILLTLTKSRSEQEGHHDSNGCGGCDVLPVCESTRTCYNCRTSSNCCSRETDNISNERVCAGMLMESETTALYGTIDKKCRLQKLDIRIEYSEGHVLTFKTCDSGCKNFTLSKKDEFAITKHTTSNDVQRSREDCKNVCLTFSSSSCAVSYANNNGKCRSSIANCDGSCTTESDQSSTLYTFTCNPADCGTLSKPLHGFVNTTFGTMEGNIAQYSCEVGFQLVGSSVRTCQPNGSWEKMKPHCEELNCSTPTSPVNGLVSYYLTTYRSTANYSCDPGYDLEGSREATCNATGVWDTQSECVPVDCGNFTDILNGFVDTSNGTTCGKMATFGCKTGFGILGSKYTTCGLDGAWNNNVPICILVDSMNPFVPINGFVNFTETTNGSNATDSCYIMIGNRILYCNLRGNWSSEAPVCTAIDCGPANTIDNGDVEYNNTTFGSQATYSCNMGYEICRPHNLTCGYDSFWTLTIQNCTIIGCVPLDPSGNIIVTYDNTTVGSIAGFTCNIGYEISGPPNSTCGNDSFWTLPSPNCTNIDSGPLEPPDNRSVTHDNTTVGLRGKYTCGNGHALSDSKPCTCQQNGSWPEPHPVCYIVGNVTPSSVLAKRLYIVPCQCNYASSFENMTEDEILEQLIQSTRIEASNTTLARSRLISKPDDRTSSKIIGVFGTVVLSMIWLLGILCDLIPSRRRRVLPENNL